MTFSKKCGRRGMKNIPTCRDCGGTPIKARGLCSKHYQGLKATYANRLCVCGELLPKYAHKYCHKCAIEAKNETDKRAKHKYRTGLEWLPAGTKGSIPRPARCRICRRSINYSLKWPHLLSPSIEHILPLSLGGDNRLDNLTHTHLWCNIKRKNNKK